MRFVRAPKKAVKQAVVRSLLQEADDTFRLNTLRPLRKVAATEKQLRSHSLEWEGALFDRYLLRSGSVYRKTRERFCELGFSGREHLGLTSAALFSFDPLTTELSYSPISKQWHLALGRGFEKNSQWFLDLLSFTTGVFHDSNHMILTDVLSPRTAGGGQSRVWYYDQIEALVAVRDWELAREHGRLSHAFFAAGVFYQKTSRPSAPTELTFEQWLAAFLWAYGRLSGEPEKTWRRSLRSLGLQLGGCDQDIQFRETFLVETVENWHSHYFERARHTGAFLWRARSPKDWFAHLEELWPVYAIYRGLFHS